MTILRASMPPWGSTSGTRLPWATPCGPRSIDNQHRERVVSDTTSTSAGDLARAMEAYLEDLHKKPKTPDEPTEYRWHRQLLTEVLALLVMQRDQPGPVDYDREIRARLHPGVITGVVLRRPPVEVLQPNLDALLYIWRTMLDEFVHLHPELPYFDGVVHTLGASVNSLSEILVSREALSLTEVGQIYHRVTPTYEDGPRSGRRGPR
jgi:hypothetical protein